MNNKIPPHSTESEEALLGAMLQSSEAIGIILSKVREEDFYLERNRIFFAAILAMYNRGVAVNAETALRYLKENNIFDKVIQNDSDYILRIIDSSPFPQNAKYYAEIIAEKSLLRDLIRATQEIQEDAFLATDDSAKETADFAEKRIFSVTQRRLDQDFSELGSLLMETLDSVELRRRQKGSVTGVPTGFHQLDDVTNGFQPSDLIILAARPSVGKTSFALNIVENIVTSRVSEDYGIGVFSLEMSKLQIAERLIASKSRVELGRIRRGTVDGKDWDKLGTTLNLLYSANILVDDSSQLTIMELRGKARQMKHRFKEISQKRGKDIDLKFIVVDYLQLLSGAASSKRMGTREQEIAEISRGLKALAKELNVPVLSLAQLSRAVENRPGDRPRLSDLRESGSIEQDADIVMFLHRQVPKDKDAEMVDEPMARNELEIVIAKHRNGRLENIKLEFHPHYTRFENPRRSPNDGGGYS